MPGKIRDLRGARFGRLVVRELEAIRDRHAYWRCDCDCGATCVTKSQRLTGGRVVSCGCFRADPAVRHAARMRTNPKTRTRIARLGGEARKARAQGD